MKKSILSIGILSIIGITLVSCKNEKETGNIIVKMTDAPINADMVNVEVVGVSVHAAGNWVNLPTNGGIYNLLDLQNGIDTTLVPGGSIPAGKVNQMRLILGQNNTIMVDSVSHPLLLSSQDETGLKLNINENFQSGVDYLIKFDFVADESIVQQGNGSYRLKPVLKKISVQPL